MPGKQAAEKGAGSDAASTPSNYLTIRHAMGTKNHILISLSESDKTQFGKEDFASQSTPQKVFSSIWALESEVNNGGFSQYLLNNSCEMAPFVAEALDSIGAPRTADICRRAIITAFPAE